jgi:hypothetical protein
MWSLSQSWYGDRLDESFVPRTPDDTQRLLDGVGLTSDFWQLKGR